MSCVSSDEDRSYQTFSPKTKQNTKTFTSDSWDKQAQTTNVQKYGAKHRTYVRVKLVNICFECIHRVEESGLVGVMFSRHGAKKSRQKKKDG